MNDGKFEWGDRKAASNIVDHGVTFDVARDVFKDPSRSSNWMIAKITAKIALRSSVWRVGVSRLSPTR
jgi:hypothetical protein